MAQFTYVLANTHLLVEGARDLGPSHTCEEGRCSMTRECGWLRRWRADRDAAQQHEPAATQQGSLF